MYSEELERDIKYWEQKLIEAFQVSEENQAWFSFKNIPIFIYDNDSKLGKLKNLFIIQRWILKSWS